METPMRASKILFGLIASAALAVAGCDQGGEGDRCNPNLSHDECGGGLSCQQPAECPEFYCCPTNGTSSNPFCQTGCAGGMAAICAVSDAGFCATTDAAATPD
jgi:hypothetical protein